MEKRRHKRVALEIPVMVRCGGNLIPATAVNISCGGMCIRTDAVIACKGNKVEVSFDLNKEKRDISLCGTVIRSENSPFPYMSVQFGNYFSLGHKVLRDFLHKQYH